jgi:DNA-binding NarL/FixJ family response regulator
LGGQPESARIRVLIVDDHPAVRRGLRTFLELSGDIDVVGEADDGAQVPDLVAGTAPDVVLLDLVMAHTDGVAALHLLRERGLSTRVLVVTSFTDGRSVLPALRAGARGYVYKDIDPQALVAAVRSVHAGHLLLEPEVAGLLLDRPAGSAAPPVLTPRERDVLRLIAQGRANREIARGLGVSEKTVKTHVSSILLKLGLADRTQAALYAVRNGLSD